MLPIVQVIVTTWSKEYRGSPLAAERNRIQEVETLPEPRDLSEQPGFLVHTVHHTFGAHPDLRISQPGLRVAPWEEPLEVGCVWVLFTGDEITVDYRWTWSGGAPHRYPVRGALRLTPGEWGTVHYNGRSEWGCCAPNWKYERWVVNIGLFREFDRRAFRERPPMKVHSQMAHLW